MKGILPYSKISNKTAWGVAKWGGTRTHRTKKSPLSWILDTPGYPVIQYESFVKETFIQLKDPN